MHLKPLLTALILLFSIIIGISSCCPKVDCAIPVGFSIRFHGFSPADLDTIYTTGYAPSTGFSQVTRPERLDTVEANWGTDSIFYFRTKSGEVLQDTHQWKLYIPAINRTLYLSDYGYRTYDCNRCAFRRSTPQRAVHTAIFNGQRQEISNLRVDK